MILIADSGSTKTQWAVVDGLVEPRLFVTPGINALMLTPGELRERLAVELLPQLADVIPDKIFFYGAGCLPHVCPVVGKTLMEVCGAPHAEVASDMLGAARALCKHNTGIACILGTGSNSCLYDGERILSNVSPLGYILGDEGSGAVLGRRLIGDVLKSQLPPDICDAFMSRYSLSPAEIVHRVYRCPEPNRFMASFVPFLADNRSDAHVHALLVDEFVRFFQRNVSSYPGYRSMAVHFVGSVAMAFADELREAALRLDITVGSIVQNPIYGMIDYHTN